MFYKSDPQMYTKFMPFLDNPTARLDVRRRAGTSLVHLLAWSSPHVVYFVLESASLELKGICPKTNKQTKKKRKQTRIK